MDDCPICKETLSETNICKTKCGHSYCLGCMINHATRNNRCPLCRAEIYESIPEEESEEDSEEEESEYESEYESEDESERYETRVYNYEIHGKFNNYEIHGIIKMNNNLQALLITTCVLFHYSIVNICVNLILSKRRK